MELGCALVYVHQVGPDQDGFRDFHEREVLGAAASRARPTEVGP